MVSPGSGGRFDWRASATRDHIHQEQIRIIHISSFVNYYRKIMSHIKKRLHLQKQLMQFLNKSLFTRTLLCCTILGSVCSKKMENKMNKDCLPPFVWRSDCHTQHHMNITLCMLPFVEDSIMMLKANLKKKEKKASTMRYKQLKSRVGLCVL